MRAAHEDACAPVRMRALELLAHRGGPDVEAVLRAAMSGDADREVRQLAEELLAR